MTIRYHVTSVLNRESIRQHGLDWRRMGAARGIAGSHQPEQEGCFLAADEWERDWFVGMNNTGGPVDVWEVSGVEDAELRQSPENFYFRPGVIPTSQIRLVHKDIEPER
ncbi:hypothetical protein CH251_00410 [Rhodococcus sp. 06-462-5]|uniref:hypothetical protein n=1 Tax=unclassified Rhodococcus (in: high G+C Gram-positive bacteria) TaxID=192944 RepID=UPI000B9ADF34|nr:MULTISPECIES: hypothetical protein [unclassified Rhodococcus (in: high G+C Gram-positive bacteria)]OZC79405.1 hypothetical protein CH251_00410 [Rhodococcus sp. 06-462-5]OZE59962.1 hypothetical protein CH270_22350 [Rhodococcus sp. 02-925g]